MGGSPGKNFVMKKFLFVLLAAAMVFSFNDAVAACSAGKKKVIKSSKSARKAKNAKNPKSVAKWYSDWSKVETQAKATHRPIMLLITGSTWCGPCQYLEKNVFSHKNFGKFAKRNLVLMKIDIPKDGSKGLRPEMLSLLKKYPYSGVPTVYILSEEGKVLEKQVGAKDASEPKFYLRRFKSLKGMR